MAPSSRLRKVDLTPQPVQWDSKPKGEVRAAFKALGFDPEGTEHHMMVDELARADINAQLEYYNSFGFAMDDDPAGERKRVMMNETIRKMAICNKQSLDSATRFLKQLPSIFQAELDKTRTRLLAEMEVIIKEAAELRAHLAKMELEKAEKVDHGAGEVDSDDQLGENVKGTQVQDSEEVLSTAQGDDINSSKNIKDAKRFREFHSRAIPTRLKFEPADHDN
ncbi:hypothetical protein IFR05_005110 [Cadophora sp. M221]|nr:hypothetical protein IFR05_005110 [Cadophora sp. M221]